MIVVRNSQHLARLLRHLRETAGYTRRQLATRLYVSPTTIANRERGCGGWDTNATIDAAHMCGYDVALVPARRRNQQPTGTGWPT